MGEVRQNPADVAVVLSLEQMISIQECMFQPIHLFQSKKISQAIMSSKKEFLTTVWQDWGGEGEEEKQCCFKTYSKFTSLARNSF